MFEAGLFKPGGSESHYRAMRPALVVGLVLIDSPIVSVMCGERAQQQLLGSHTQVRIPGICQLESPASVGSGPPCEPLVRSWGRGGGPVSSLLDTHTSCHCGYQPSPLMPHWSGRPHWRWELFQPFFNTLGCWAASASPRLSSIAPFHCPVTFPSSSCPEFRKLHWRLAWARGPWRGTT